MTSPAAGTSAQSASNSGLKPPLTKYVSSASMSLERLVSPATYHFLRSGWWDRPRIVAMPPDSLSNRDQETTPLISGGSDSTCNPFTTICERLCWGTGTDGWIGTNFGVPVASGPPSTSPTHFIRRTGVKAFTLVEGEDDRSGSRDAKKLIDFQIEAWLGTTSTFIRPDDPSRRALLWKADGLNPWWSAHRTLDDFDNIRYICHTSFCSGNITITRLSDHTVVARFIRARVKLTWGLIGILQVVETVTEDFLDLIFCAIYTKYLLDDEERRSSNR